MSQSFKRINFQSQHKNTGKVVLDKKSYEKNSKTQNTLSNHSCVSKKKSTHNSINHYMHFISNKFSLTHAKENVQNLNLKLNRVQSEYIRPHSSNSVTKTPVTTSKKPTAKTPIDPSKITIKKTSEFHIPNDYPDLEVSNQNNNNIFCKEDAKMFESYEKTKKQQKTSKISRTPNTMSQGSTDKNKKYIKKVSQNKNLSTKDKISHKSQLKKTNKKRFALLNFNDHESTAIIKKTPSSCSVKKYYVLQKNQVSEKKSEKKQVINSTSRGTKTSEINQSIGSRKLSTTLLKNFNSSTDFSDTNSKSQTQKMLLQRIQRTLECYQVSLKTQISKRRNLEEENSMLKEELIKAINGTKI